MNRFTEHLEKVGDKFRIRETFSATPINTSSVTEKVIVEGKEYNTHKHYTFRIWDKNFNANGRNYSKVIDEVIQKNLITYGLSDHPEENCESVKDICMVEKNPRMIDGWMCVDGYPIGEYGRRIEEILDVGGGIEVSSSVLGDIDDEGYIEHGVETERYFDWVLNCSNRQIQYADHIEQREDDKVDNINLVSETGCVQETKEENKLTILNNDSVVKVCDTDNATEQGEKIMAEVITEKVAEQVKLNLSLNIKGMLKEAKSKENVFEKKEILESANLYAKQLDDEVLAKEVEDELCATEDEIKTLSTKGLEVDGLNASMETLKKENDELIAKLKKVEDEKKEVEDQLDVVTEMYESKQFNASKTELEKSHNLAKEVCSLKIKSKKLESKIAILERKNSILENRAKRAENDLEITEAKLNSMVSADTYAKILEEKELAKKELRTMRIKKLREEETSSDDRLASLKRKLRKSEDEVVDSTITEEDDEDEKMEKMLKKVGMDFVDDSTPEQYEEDDEDSVMEKALKGEL